MIAKKGNIQPGTFRVIPAALAMATLHYMDCIPKEMLELILKSEVLDQRDIGNISLTCRYFCQVCQSNELWKCKLQQRWPALYDRYDRSTQRCWRDLYKLRVVYGHKVRQMVSALSPEYYHMQEMSRDGFGRFVVLMDEGTDTANCVIDELMEIVQDGQRHEKLTKKYYGEKVLRHLHQIHLAGEWQSFLQLPSAEQNLEEGAVLIARWCQSTVPVTRNSISDQIEVIANMAKRELANTSPNHAAVTAKDLNRNALKEHLWSPPECQVVLQAINSVMFDRLGFQGNSDNYYNPNNSYLNKVLETKKGIPITLCVLYMSVASRLGVKCEPVNFPSHFLLKWREKPCSLLHNMYKYIDVFNGGRFYKQEECCRGLSIPESLGSVEGNFRTVLTKRVLERMARNLVGIGRQLSQVGDSLLCLRNALDLFLIICPDDMEMRLLQVRINLHLNINLSDVMESLQLIADLDPTRMGLVAYLQQEAQTLMKDNEDNRYSDKMKVKLRHENPGVSFSVGMIMKHKRYDYTCVIYGWDSTCQASEEWIIQMGVHNLPNKHKQPFYNVLVDDGSNRYAAEESLLYSENPKEISHPEVGRYFQTFVGTHYIPNSEKKQEYPDDVAVTQSFLESVDANK